jgi:hypothetical protein
MNRYLKGTIFGVIGVAAAFVTNKARKALSRPKPTPVKTNPELRKV